MIRWVKSLFAWRVVHDSGVWLYEENQVTGCRRVVKYSSNHQPVDMVWLGDGRMVK